MKDFSIANTTVYRVLRKFVPIFAPMSKTKTRLDIQMKLFTQYQEAQIYFESHI